MKQHRDMQAETFSALAHPLRIKILEKLRGGPCCVCRIIPHVGAEQSNVSHHLAVLKNAGIVASRKKGMEVWYEVRDPRIFKVLDLIRELIAGQIKQNHELFKELLGTER